MKAITSTETHEVTGRGIIKSVKLSQGPFRKDEELIVDGSKYRVTDIEMTKGLFGYGENVGLVVRLL